jgi:hypothetical protein
MTWKEMMKDAIKDRGQFLEICPTMKDWVEQGEAIYGKFIGIASVPFTDERCVFVYKFEQTYFCSFSNPANPKGEQTKEFALSYEAMSAFSALHSAFRTAEDARRFYNALGIEKEKIEEAISETEAELNKEYEAIHTFNEKAEKGEK